MVRVDRPRRDSRNVGAMGKKDSGVASVVALAANGEVKKKKKKKKVKDADKAAAASVAKVGGSNWAALSTVSTREGAITFPESHRTAGGLEERRGVDLDDVHSTTSV